MWRSGYQVRARTLHKPVSKRFPRNLYTIKNIDDIFEMDLADLISLSKYYSKYKYVLKVPCVFSRYAWSAPLKDKSATSIIAATKSLFQNIKPVT
jgi:hypothetical protein